MGYFKNQSHGSMIFIGKMVVPLVPLIINPMYTLLYSGYLLGPRAPLLKGSNRRVENSNSDPQSQGFSQHFPYEINKHSRVVLVGGFNPFEKHWSNWIMNPHKFGVKIQKICELPPPSHQLLVFHELSYEKNPYYLP